MSTLYFEYLPIEVITILISRLGANDLKALIKLYKSMGLDLMGMINWRDLYSIRYPYFIQLYRRAGKNINDLLDYEMYLDILNLEELPYLSQLYDCIIYGYTGSRTYRNDSDMLKQYPDSSRSSYLNLDYDDIKYNVKERKMELHENFWDRVQLLSELFVVKAYPKIYDKFRNFKFDIYEYSIMNDALSSLVFLDEKLKPYISFRSYIITGIWDENQVITMDKYDEFVEAYAENASEYLAYNPYIIDLLMTCAMLEDNFKAASDADAEYIVDYIINYVTLEKPDSAHRVIEPLRHRYPGDEADTELEAYLDEFA